jgi:hypothetical protein
MKFFVAIAVIVGLSVSIMSQRPAGTPEVPAAVPAKEILPDDDPRGISEGRTYSNYPLGFRITFPETWQIAGDDLEEIARAEGFDLGLTAPDNIDTVSRLQLQRSLERVVVLLTAYRAKAESKDNAILRVTIEDLSLVPAVKDAVDYFDLMRSQFSVMRLPADFTYSETQAERLGKMQFAFLDTSNSAGKKRMYATVRRGVAIMFTLSYTNTADLNDLKRILSEGDFALAR